MLRAEERHNRKRGMTEKVRMGGEMSTRRSIKSRNLTPYTSISCSHILRLIRALVFVMLHFQSSQLMNRNIINEWRSGDLQMVSRR